MLVDVRTLTPAAADFWKETDLMTVSMLPLARAKLQEQGFDLVSEETARDGRIHLVLRRMA